jgi:CARDB/Vanadium chloroperoxidase N-terminal domain
MPETLNTIAAIGDLQSGDPTRKPVPKMGDLSIQFRQVELPDSIEFGDRGKARVTITNTGDRPIDRPVTINLIVSTDETIDLKTPNTVVASQNDLKNDGLLATVTRHVQLKPGESKTLTLDYNNLTSVVSPGAYRLIAEVDPLNTIPEGNETNNQASRLVSAPKTDGVLDWISTFLNAVQEDPESGDAAGSGPLEGSYNFAVLSAAIYDTVNAFDRCYTPYLVDRRAPKNASLEAAVAGAASTVLSALYPNEATAIATQLERSLAEAGRKHGKVSKGYKFGVSVAQSILASPPATALSVADPDTGYTYTPPAGDYVWHTDPPRNVALGAGYGEDAIPFAVPDSDTFRPTLGYALNSDAYAQEIEQVRKLGGKANTATTAIERTADQTQTIEFWAYDRADTFRPYGQPLQIAQEIAIREGNSIGENARLFLQLGLTFADASITAWDAKYTDLQPRPEDVIAGRIDELTGQPVAPLAQTDNRADTIPDRDWKPALAVGTPPFPDYISGHASFGGGFAAVMTDFFGENYKFNAVSQEQLGTIRHFESFEAAGQENALSRVYGGIHIQVACVDGFNMGKAVGDYVVDNIARPIA